MTEAAQKLLDAFDTLPGDERHHVAVEILRRTALLGSDPPADDELMLAADRIFLDLERHERSR